MIVAIVAHDYNMVIGKGNDLPWHLSEDLKLFKKITTGHVVVMGRKTWDSIPEKYRPLPDRLNIVLTRGEENCDPNVIFTNKWEAALNACHCICPDKHIFVIGGASIYDYTINEAPVKVDRILLSLVDGVHEGDVFFPKLKGTWADVHVSSHEGFKLIEKIRYETCIPLDSR